jgi:glutaminyl-peptide cyclotransferase
MRIAMYSKYLKIGLPLIIVILVGLAIYLVRSHGQSGHIFDAQRTYNDVTYQLDLGPRILGSAAHEEATKWIVAIINKSGWQVETQETVIAGQSIKNIIAKRGSGIPWVVIGSHYDSRAVADQDPNPELHNQPVPGANDGASTVAILLELARVMPANLNKQVWLVFFDDEDNGNSSGVGWSIGSKYFVSQLHGKPDSVVILDMLGDKNLDIYMEKNSYPELNNQIWAIAKELGYSQFIPSYKYAIIDDHLPFIEAGIPAVDVIDFNYPYWHTTQDTLDKISTESLKAAGDTVLAWLEH